jgi:putative hemolysin
MKKTLIIIAVMMALGTSSFASPVSQQWIKTYGTNNENIIHCIQQTMDGGYIAIGNTRTSPYAVIDLLILKLDVNG